MRDAQSLLDQVVSYCGMEVRDEDVDQILGYVGVETLAQCLRALFQQDAAAALHIASLLQSEGHEATGIARALLEGLRHLIVLKTVPHPDDLIPLSEADLATLRTVAGLASLEEIYGQFHVLSAAEQTLRHASNPFLGLEMTLVRMACIGHVQSLQSILEHLQRLETGLPAVSVSPASSGTYGGINRSTDPTVSASPAASAVWEEEPAAAVTRQARHGTPLPEAPASVVLTTAEGLWEALQQRITERRPALGGPMQHGRPLTLEERRLVVGFAKQDKFSLEYLLDPENLMVIRDTAQALLGRPLQIVLEPLSDEAAGSGAASGTRVAAEQEASALEEAQRQKNELKQAVIDIFGAIPI